MNYPEDFLEKQFPFIDWRKPQMVEVLGRGTNTMCCRFCIAIDGLRAEDVERKGFDREEDFAGHMVEYHRREPSLGLKRIAGLKNGQ